MNGNESTGGTIAMIPDDSGGVVPILSTDDLLDAVQQFNTVVVVEAFGFSNVPSPHFDIRDMYDLAEYLDWLSHEDAMDGLDVNHGADVLEETPYFAQLCFTGVVPVAFTVAIRTPSALSPDGPGNLLAGVVTARQATDPDVFVTFNDRINAYWDVTKAHTMAADAFESHGADRSKSSRKGTSRGFGSGPGPRRSKSRPGRLPSAFQWCCSERSRRVSTFPSTGPCRRTVSERSVRSK